jgi:Zn-dependent protease with chaperone function
VARFFDVDITCRDCGDEFAWSTGEQAFYEQRQLSRPKHCSSCRKAKRTHHDQAVADPATRLERAAQRVRSVSELEFSIRIVSDVDGDPMNAAANCENRDIIATAALIRLLGDDELTWVVAHEVAHLEHDDRRRKVALLETSETSARAVLRATDTALRRSGHGFIARIGAQAVTAILATTATLVASRAQSRLHEFQADARGVEIGSQLNLNPAAAIRALEKINQGPIDIPFLLELTCRHPDFAARVAHIERQRKSRNGVGVTAVDSR